MSAWLEDPKFLVALVGAIAAITSAVITGIISVFLKRKADTYLENLRSEQTRILEKVKADLALENKSKGARIDYEYEARKRLYKEVEPVLFCAHLAVTNVHGRLKAMADRIREGHIAADRRKTWMGDQYYQRSTAYRLFLPMAHYRLISRRISQLDLTLEPTIGRKFMTLGIFEEIFVAHFELSEIPEAKIPYNPYASVSEAERRANPGIYNFQGLVRGEVEQLVSAMISSSSSEMTPLEWFRFDQELNKKESELGSAYLPLRDVLLGFHPETHPIVWRALISFFLLAHYYTSANRLEVEEYDSCVEKMGWNHFDYRTPKEREMIAEVVARQHFEAARRYIRGRLMEKHQTLATSRIEAS